MRVASHQFQSNLFRSAGRDTHPDLGVSLTKSGSQLRQYIFPRRGAACDSQLACSLLQGGHHSLQVGRVIEQPMRPRHEQSPGLRQTQTSTHSLEQDHSQLIFQCLDMMTDCGLAEVQQLRRF